MDYFKEKPVLFFSSCFLLSGFVLILFYMPQDAMSEKFSFNQILIEKVTPYETTGRIEITNKKDLDEFANIFRGYKCRRAINLSSQTSLDSKSIFIDLLVRVPQENRTFPFHFVVTEDNLIRYTAGNTSFLYKIKDAEHKLENEIYNYVNKHLDTDSIEPTLVSEDLPKNSEAFALEWMDDDKLIYHSDKGLFAYSPSTNTAKTLMLEEPRGNYLAWVGYPLYSWYFGISPDKSKYLMATGERYSLEIHESKTDAIISSFYFKSQIKESGWVNNDKVFITTKYGLFIIDITTGKQIQVTEDSTEVYAKAAKDTQESYIKWAENVCILEQELFYNGVRGPNDLISSIIYKGDEFGEQKILDKAILQLRVNNGSFVYLKQSELGYDGYYLYDVNTKKSILITKEELINTGGIYLTNDNKLAFMIDTLTKGVYEGEIFDPVTLNSQKYKMSKKDFEDSDLLHRQFGRLMGAFEKNGAYIFLFNVRDSNKCMSYNTKTNIISELRGYENRIGINSIADIYIGPTGKYTVIASNYKLFDVVNSENLLP